MQGTWLERWERPSCWMALSADQGSSMVTCTLRRWFLTSLLACRLMPVLAASDTMATSFSPRMKAAAHSSHGAVLDMAPVRQSGRQPDPLFHAMPRRYDKPCGLPHGP